MLKRDIEHEIVPMCRHFGMALAAWEVLGGGKLQTAAQIAARERSTHGVEQTAAERRMSEALEKVARELKEQGQGEFSVTAVAIAFVIRRTRYCYPIVGGRKAEHLRDNVKAFDIRLSDEQVKFLEEVEGVQGARRPFPTEFILDDPHETGENGYMHASTAHLKWQTNGKPVL